MESDQGIGEALAFISGALFAIIGMSLLYVVTL